MHDILVVLLHSIVTGVRLIKPDGLRARKAKKPELSMMEGIMDPTAPQHEGQ